MATVYTLPLQHGMLTLVDREDYEKYKDWTFVSNRWGSVVGYLPPAPKTMPNRLKRLARLILGLTDKKIEADHINNDQFDNRRSNLRPVTSSQNKMNRRAGKSDRSLPKGVDFRKDYPKNPYRADITVNKKVLYLGSFTNADDAAMAYNEAAKKYFGEYARPNPL